jgi:uncharacterized membrane protein
MKLSAGTIGFWTNIAMAIVTAIVIAYFFNWIFISVVYRFLSDSFLDINQYQHWTFWIILTICVVIKLSSFLYDLKQKLVDGMPDEMRVSKASIEDYPGLDRAKFAEYTESLQLRGFTHVIDFAAREVYSDRTKEIPGLSRLLIHYETKCYGVIFQALLPGREPFPVYCTIASDFGDRGSLVNSSYEMNSISLFWRKEPKDIWFSIPTAKPDQLYRDHLNLRSLMRAELNSPPLEVSEAAFFEHEQQDTKHRKNKVKSTNLFFSMIKATWFELNPYHCWLGDYAKVKGIKAKAREIVSQYGLS